ncbi:MAG: metallophosphatase domain-containing protein [Bacteroidales bacterium]|jgi:Icc-related predicted phosphoesterase|nr:metallophosphatase domain-containing protein [Bacteroidales bacterium]
MKILHLSDTHSRHHALQNLPIADIIIHSGDMLWAGASKEVLDFIDWFGGLDYKYKIFIAGNHDDCFEGRNREIIQNFLPKNCFYLCNSGIEIEGIQFWGVPLFMSDDINGRLPQMMAQIPADTDILITHSPPFGILDTTDNSYGCPDLLQAVLKIKPKYHLFGHVHGAYGIEKSAYTTFVNAALMNENYELVNNPVLLEV